ncbi:MAG: T9SS type A sorting domain-containing protein [Flavobacteriales bacterium]|nr:T9SS type A sorting domain-containing protein [Flavobacteriales bacterium]
MKKKLLISIFGISVLLFIVSTNTAVSYTNGAPNTYTGSGGDGKTCGTNGGCHSGGAAPKIGWIETNIPANGYVTSTTYNVSITVSETGTSKFGFSATAEDAFFTHRGSWISFTGTTSIGDYLTHTVQSTSAIDSKTWVAQWTSPQEYVGDITFYAALLAANGNSNSTGDNVYTSELTVASSVTSISEANKKNTEFRIYPTAFTTNLIIEYEVYNGALLLVYDIKGSIVYSKILTHSISDIDLSQLSGGTYVIVVENTLGASIQKVIKR